MFALPPCPIRSDTKENTIFWTQRQKACWIHTARLHNVSSVGGRGHAQSTSAALLHNVSSVGGRGHAQSTPNCYNDCLLLEKLSGVSTPSGCQCPDMYSACSCASLFDLQCYRGSHWSASHSGFGSVHFEGFSVKIRTLFSISNTFMIQARPLVWAWFARCGKKWGFLRTADENPTPNTALLLSFLSVLAVSHCHGWGWVQ